jgi:hypothetical protein
MQSTTFHARKRVFQAMWRGSGAMTDFSTPMPNSIAPGLCHNTPPFD